MKQDKAVKKYRQKVEALASPLEDVTKQVLINPVKVQITQLRGCVPIMKVAQQWRIQI